MRPHVTWSVPAGVRRAASVLLAIVVPAHAAAQQPTGATPDELTEAIVRYTFRGDGGNARLVPGRVPDDLAPNFHAPRGSRVLGTVLAGSHALVLLSTLTPPESLRAEYVRALGPRGWALMEAPSRGGFVPTVSDLPLVLCRGDSQLSIQFRRRATPPHDLYLDYRDTPSMCRDAALEVTRFERMDQPRFPTLHLPEAPPGASVAGCYSRAGRRRGSSSMGTAIVVAFGQSAEDLMQHFGRQLEAAGWRPPSASTARMVSRTWERSDSTGTSQVTLELTEGAPGSRCYEVQMKVAR